MQIMFPFPGFNEYPVLQLTVNEVPVEPPVDGVTLAAFVTVLLPLQELASHVGGLFQLFETQIMLPFPGFNVNPVLQPTVNAVPVEPPVDGVTLPALVTVLLPLQEFAEIKISMTCSEHLGDDYSGQFL